MQDSRESLMHGALGGVEDERTSRGVQSGAAVKERAPGWLMLATGALARGA